MTDRISTDELRKLLAEATPGPWVFDGNRVKASDRTVSDLRYKNGKNDGLLIASAPDLAAEVIRLREALEEIATDCEADYPPSHGAIKYFTRAALNHKETDDGAS